MRWSHTVRAGESRSATVTWWMVMLILVVGLLAGLLLARIERVRIRTDEQPGELDEAERERRH